MTDRDLLDSLDKKLAIVRDRTRGVALGYATGFHLWGEGGTSKTYTVTKTLDGLKKPYKVTNSRLTGKGLFELLDAYPDIVHVLDDVETMFADQNSHGVLRAALWGMPGEPRSVTWQSGTEGRREVVFTGGVVLIANSPLDNVPALRALKTRVASVRYQPTNEELAARMRQIAAEGFEHVGHRLDPAACLEVADAILQRTVKMSRNLDLRLLVNGMADRVQFEAGLAEVHWLDLLDSRIQERTVPPKQPLTRLDREAEFAKSISHLPPEERLRVCEEETGKCRASLYRRLKGGSQPN